MLAADYAPAGFLPGGASHGYSGCLDSQGGPTGLAVWMAPSHSHRAPQATCALSLHRVAWASYLAAENSESKDVETGPALGQPCSCCMPTFKAVTASADAGDGGRDCSPPGHTGKGRDGWCSRGDELPQPMAQPSKSQPAPGHSLTCSEGF